MSINEEKNKIPNKKIPKFQERFNLLRGNLTQAEFATKIGISRPTVGFYENGERIPDGHVLKLIAAKCKVSIDWLLGMTDVKDGNADDMEVEKKLGLSAESIMKLKHNQILKNDPRFVQKCKDILYAINTLLENEHSDSILWIIGSFLNSEYEKTTAFNKATGQLEKIIPELIDSSSLVVLQKALQNLKNKLYIIKKHKAIQNNKNNPIFKEEGE